MTDNVRTIALIGATSGLGRAAVDQLAKDGHTLILVGRDPARVIRLTEQFPTATVIGADISTIAGINVTVRRIADTVDRLDALINNAGVMIPDRRITSEGFELNFAIHHLAPYSITSGLLPLLMRGTGRVVNVNSEGHRAPLFGGGQVSIDFDDLNMEHDYDPFLAYSRTKLANLLFSYELQRRHPELSVVAIHPGMVRTDLGRHWPRIRVAAMHAMSTSARKGAEPVVSLATTVSVQPGAYYNQLSVTRSSPQSYDLAAAQRLWDVTTQLRGQFGKSHESTPGHDGYA